MQPGGGGVLTPGPGGYAPQHIFLRREAFKDHWEIRISEQAFSEITFLTDHWERRISEHWEIISSGQTIGR